MFFIIWLIIWFIPRTIKQNTNYKRLSQFLNDLTGIEVMSTVSLHTLTHNLWSISELLSTIKCVRGYGIWTIYKNFTYMRLNLWLSISQSISTLYGYYSNFTQTKIIVEKNTPNVSILAALTLLFSATSLLPESSSLDSYLIVSVSITLIAAATIFNAKNKNQLNAGLSIFSLFFYLVYLLITTKNILVFITVYELFLLPSAYLVYKASPNKRSLRSCFYFLVWTQAGSLLAVFGATGLVWVNQSTTFSDLTNCPTSLALLILIGFGVKIPVFPFFFWLTKTHVEAISSFSIYLSGFLVKLAIFGLIKFNIIFFNPTIMALTLIIALTSVAVATISFYYQTDYKKIVAYATIQEMNILLLLLCMSYWQDIRPTGTLLVVHTALSAIFFTLADTIYKRHKTRALKQIKGLLVTTPILYTSMLISLVIFKGIPFSSKFSIEFSLYSIMYVKCGGLFIMLLGLLVFLGNALISIQHFKIAFGQTTEAVYDLTLKELLVLATPIATLIFIIN